MRHLPPSRTYTLAASGMQMLMLICAALLLLLCASMLANIDASLRPQLLDVIGSCVWSIAGLGGVGAGAMAARDSASKGATTSGTQLLDAAAEAGRGG